VMPLVGSLPDVAGLTRPRASAPASATEATIGR
jgi:hypothetical protein